MKRIEVVEIVSTRFLQLQSSPPQNSVICVLDRSDPFLVTEVVPVWTEDDEGHQQQHHALICPNLLVEFGEEAEAKLYQKLGILLNWRLAPHTEWNLSF